MNKIEILCVSIVDEKLLNKADAVVNATNPYMIFGSGVCGAIFKKAGIQELESYCKDTWKSNMHVGEIRITPGFNIPCDIIFAQGPKLYDYKEYDLAEKDLLMTYVNLLNSAIEKGYKKIIVPSLGTGTYGFKHEVVAKHVLSILNDPAYSSLTIFFVNNSQEVCDFYKKVFVELNENKK
ncbi:MAG TPA: macro domain-containing protein [Erysipelotrichaceae bacterium]|nr:macro domain-containing protein [Erysipelotrichaceae bacterium]